MLSLTRKVGQSLVIGGEVIVTVVHCRGGRARLGIQAPSCVGVLRSELIASEQGDPAERIRQALAMVGVTVDRCEIDQGQVILCGDLSSHAAC